MTPFRGAPQAVVRLPSVTLAIALAVALEARAQGAVPEETITWAAEQSPASAALGTQWEFLATSGQTGGAYSLVQITAQASRGPPLHTHAAREGFYVLDGQFEFTVGKARTVVKAGGFVTIPSGVQHRWRNTSATAGRLLCFITPGGMEGLFKDLGEPVPGRASLSAPAGSPKAPPDVTSKTYGVVLLEGPPSAPLK